MTVGKDVGRQYLYFAFSVVPRTRSRMVLLPLFVYSRWGQTLSIHLLVRHDSQKPNFDSNERP